MKTNKVSQMAEQKKFCQLQLVCICFNQLQTCRYNRYFEPKISHAVDCLSTVIMIFHINTNSKFVVREISN